MPDGTTPTPAAPSHSGRHASVTPRSHDELWTLARGGELSSNQAMRYLGQALVSHGLVTRAQLLAALQTQQEMAAQGRRRPVGQILIEAGALTEVQLRSEIAAWLGRQQIDPTLLPHDPAALGLLSREKAEQLQVLPLMVRDDSIVVLVADPDDRALLDQLRFITQRRVLALQAAPEALATALRRAYRIEGEGRTSARDLAALLGNSSEVVAAERTDVVSESDNTLVRLVHSIIDEAITQGASDIHIETEQAPKNTHVRVRVDGRLRPYLDLQARFRFAIVARIKIMASLDISEHRKPQDGKIDFARFGGPKVELRVLTLPTSKGLEDVVVRVLAAQKPLPLDRLGLSVPSLEQLRAAVRKSYGLILVCGPTGSGKTTTLHSVIREINHPERKIWTAENPVEITQEGLRQVEVNPRIGWTFAAAMRSFLRADPDVIMIGEMRDEETARIAIDASLTGHLVLSTLHTNSAAESVTRLLEMGMDPFTFSDALIVIVAQRLVRCLCPQCRQPVQATPETLHGLAEQYLMSSGNFAQAQIEVLERARAYLVDRWTQEMAQRGHHQPMLWQRVGCAQCDATGYKGRFGIHELLICNDAIREHIRHRHAAHDIRSSALRAGMKTLRQDGIEKVLLGLTDMQEVLLATNL